MLTKNKHVTSEEKSYSAIRTKRILAIQQLPALYHISTLSQSGSQKSKFFIVKFVTIVQT